MDLCTLACTHHAYIHGGHKLMIVVFLVCVCTYVCRWSQGPDRETDPCKPEVQASVSCLGSEMQSVDRANYCVISPVFPSLPVTDRASQWPGSCRLISAGWSPRRPRDTPAPPHRPRFQVCPATLFSVCLSKTVSHYIPGSLRTHFIDNAGLKLRKIFCLWSTRVKGMLFFFT